MHYNDLGYSSLTELGSYHPCCFRVAYPFQKLAQVAKYAEEQSTIQAEAKALIMKSKQKEAANTKLWEEVHQAAQVNSGYLY